jgi:hypothetical protein
MGMRSLLFNKLKFKPAFFASVKAHKTKYSLMVLIAGSLLFSFNNCAKVSFTDLSPLESALEIQTQGVALVSGAIEKQNAEGYRISASLGHYVEGIEKVTSSGHKVCLSMQGDMNCGGWEYQVIYRK